MGTCGIGLIGNISGLGRWQCKYLLGHGLEKDRTHPNCLYNFLENCLYIEQVICVCIYNYFSGCVKSSMSDNKPFIQ